MVREVSLSELRERMGIKRLRKKIPLSEADKAAIRNLRQKDKRRVTRFERLKA